MRFRSLTAAAAAIAMAVAPVAANAQATVRNQAVQVYDGAGAVPSWAAVPAFLLAMVAIATAIGAINRSRPLPAPPPPTSP
jgi:hypothetical protein